MKACLLQTLYSATDPAFQEEGFARELAMLDSLDDPDIDIIVIPEYAESLFAPRTHEEFRDQIADPDYEGYCHCLLYYKEK